MENSQIKIQEGTQTDSQDRCFQFASFSKPPPEKVVINFSDRLLDDPQPIKIKSKRELKKRHDVKNKANKIYKQIALANFKKTHFINTDRAIKVSKINPSQTFDCNLPLKEFKPVQVRVFKSGEDLDTNTTKKSMHTNTQIAFSRNAKEFSLRTIDPPLKLPAATNSDLLLVPQSMP